HRILKASGSFVLDTGASWNRGLPTRNLYQFKLLIALCDEVGFHLAQDFFWWNPAKLPTPAEWVTVRRIRVKDAVNCVWWLSKSPWPKASNRRVLQPYTRSMETLFRNGYSRSRRPSGHKPSAQFSKNNGAAIPPNLLAVANTDSRSSYIKYCRSEGLQPHPARFPREIPEFFIRMLTDPSDVVVDPFAGSSMTGAVCERLERRWLCIDVVEDYLKGAIGRFIGGSEEATDLAKTRNIQYQIPRVGSLWDGASHTSPLRNDGGKSKRAKQSPRS
ncbi:site-specific DNA-methyltransferase, partial [Candidatus Bipolaricaulota bacterium]|nr:site-specific DNA-methyltransferase [Candidatus Bipolaricaulota bacterium]